MKSFGRVLLNIFDGIAKVLGFLLLSLGLWLPALFSVVFFVVCGVMNANLSGGTMVAYWCGLGITAVLGFLLSMDIRARRKRKAEAAQNVAAQPVKEKVRGRKKNAPPTNQSAATYANPAQQGQNGYAQTNMASQGVPYGGYPQNPYPPQQPYAQTYAQPNPYAPPPQNPYPPQQPYGGQTYAQNTYAAQPAPEPQRTPPRQDTSDLDRKYFSDSKQVSERYERTASFENDAAIPQPYGKTMSKTQEREADSRLDADELWRRLSGADVPDEKPLVFRTRQDPDVYVYEYSDRYQYWRRTKTGMVFERTEFKKKVVR